jgi:hypothetical protein
MSGGPCVAIKVPSPIGEHRRDCRPPTGGTMRRLFAVRNWQKIILAFSEQLRYPAPIGFFLLSNSAKHLCGATDPCVGQDPYRRPAIKLPAKAVWGNSLHPSWVTGPEQKISRRLVRSRQVSLGVIVNADNTSGTNPAIIEHLELENLVHPKRPSHPVRETLKPQKRVETAKREPSALSNCTILVAKRLVVNRRLLRARRGHAITSSLSLLSEACRPGKTATR